jgi:ParB/RepB/Spo0J family partition protein
VACSPECHAAWRAEARAASLRQYWHSKKGLGKTAARVAACRKKQQQAQNVTHSAAQEVGPSAIVDPLAAPAPVTETEPEMATSVETSHGQRWEDVRECGNDEEPKPCRPEADRACAPAACAGAASAGPTCARCHRAGVVEIVDRGDDDARTPRERRSSRAGSRSWPMSATETVKPCPVAMIGTTLRRARCRQPARIERMKQSLTAHGQLTPVVAVVASEGIELIDGFKRHAAARMLGRETLIVSIQPLDETGRWAAMLLLNRGPSSMTPIEEAMVLREIAKMGLTQMEIASLCGRHKTWVSRRIGLVERLHPELVEAMKLGILHPGVTRRLLSLPPGNQLELSATIQSTGLRPRDTELLVGLWHRTKDPAARRALLIDPRQSLAKHHPETLRPPLDPRLSPEGQRLLRSLRRLESATTETSQRLRLPLPPKDLEILDKDLRQASKAASRLATELGPAKSAIGASASDESGATS